MIDWISERIFERVDNRPHRIEVEGCVFWCSKEAWHLERVIH